jgi:serine/threonine protein kinase
MTMTEDLSGLFRYQVSPMDRVTTGGCGELWRAHDRLLDRTVGLKTIRAELATDARAVRSFELEAIAAARLSATNQYIVPVFDLGRLGSLYYLVMEWIPASDGERPDIASLAGNCSLVRARKILMQVADAVAYAHSRGVVHSDIAPWNILYRPTSDSYLLADFGLLKIVERDLISLPSRSLLTGGRLAFLPPYARRDAAQIGYGSDVYALAMTLVLVGGRDGPNARRRHPGRDWRACRAARCSGAGEAGTGTLCGKSF